MSNYVLNGIGHFEISGPDADSLGRFYHKLFGWAVDSQGPGYSLVRTPEGSPDGAIAETEQAALSVAVVVSEIDEVMARVGQHGGAIVMPVTDNGWVKKGSFRDPAGNVMIVIEG